MAPGFAILFAAVIVLGVVGGQVMQTVLKELLPLLRTLVQERQARVGAAPSQDLLAELQAIRVRIAQIEEDHERLSEANAFLQRLLDDRLQPQPLPSASHPREPVESGSGLGRPSNTSASQPPGWHDRCLTAGLQRMRS